METFRQCSNVFAKEDYLWFVSFGLFYISCFFILLWNDSTNLIPLGGLLVLSSITTLFRCRKIPLLLLLFAIIAYINISSAVLDYFLQGSLMNKYQTYLRLSDSGLTNAKMFLLNFDIVSIMITPSFLKKAAIKSNIYFYQEKKNLLIAYSLLISCVIITLTQFNGNAGEGYVSNNSVLYEYVVIFMIVGLNYIGNDKLLKKLYIGCGLLYVFIGVIGGDRSSAFMALIVFAVYFFSDKITIKAMLFLSFMGILSSNIIGILRNSWMSLESLFNVLKERSFLFFFSDTVSASFYSGITIIEYSKFTDNKLSIFQWIESLFVGVTQNTNIVHLASRMNYNGGGGLFHSCLGYLGGYTGVICGAILLGASIQLFFSNNRVWNKISQIAFLALVFRWYLYTPVSFYRTILINLNLIFLFFLCVDKLTAKRR